VDGFGGRRKKALLRVIFSRTDLCQPVPGQLPRVAKVEFAAIVRLGALTPLSFSDIPRQHNG